MGIWSCFQSITSGVSCLKYIFKKVESFNSVKKSDDDTAASGSGTLWECGIFLLSSVLAWLMMAEFLHDNFNSIVSWKYHCENDQCFGISSAGKILWALIVYHSILLTLSAVIRCISHEEEEEEDASARQLDSFHEGYWPAKVVLWIGLTILAILFIPYRWIQDYLPAWVGCALLFVLFQLSSTVDFAFDIAKWSSNSYRESEDPSSKKVALGFITVLLNKGLLWVNLIFGTLAIFTAAIDWDEEGDIATIVASTCSCKGERDLSAFIPPFLFITICAVYATYSLISGYMSFSDTSCRLSSQNSGFNIFFTIISGILLFGSTAWVAYKVLKVESMDNTDDKKSDPGESSDAKEYNSFWRHLIYRLVFICAIMYIFMMISNWGSITDTGTFSSLGFGDISAWVKIVSSWVIYVIYFLIMFCGCLEKRGYSGPLSGII
jgi:hypothetical protein